MIEGFVIPWNGAFYDDGYVSLGSKVTQV